MICRLCLKDTVIRNSHIIPEFFYRATYDEKNRLLEISLNPDVPNKRVRQKGIREFLCCDDCEGRLSKAEKYAREVLYGGIKLAIRARGRIVEISNLDYVKFRTFLLSILWRAGISSDPFFSAVDVGRRHEERLRRMILTGDVGEPYEYGCSVTYVARGEFPIDDDFDGLILNPVKRRVRGHTTYRFFFGSLVWLFFVSSHTKVLPAGSFFLRRDGLLKVDVKKFEELPFLYEWATDLKNSGKAQTA